MILDLLREACSSIIFILLFLVEIIRVVNVFVVIHLRLAYFLVGET